MLNDAILAAALDLGKRDKTRRKIIFIISEGREYRSSASYRDVIKVLLTNGVLVMGLVWKGPPSLCMESYRSYICPARDRKYPPKVCLGDRGGGIYRIFREAIESVYSRAIGDARNQYTLGTRPGVRPAAHTGRLK